MCESRLLQVGAIEFPQHIHRNVFLLTCPKSGRGASCHLASKDTGYEGIQLAIQFGLKGIVQHPFGPT